MSLRILLILLGGIVVLSGGVFVWQRQKLANGAPTPTVATTSLPTNEVIPTVTPTINSAKIIKVSDIPNVASQFKFEASIPIAWQAEAVPSIESINLYDSSAPGTSNIEKSQIFIRSFSANTFLTLSTVTIHSKIDKTINGRPTVEYDIEKKAGVTDFANQPSWRNKRHIVTDIRESDTNPSIFYVIAKRPDLDPAVYEQFLASFSVTSKSSSLIEPVAEFKARITKKPFGILIDPDTSPVQPERFSGYHTGVDIEFEDKKEDVPVKAIADGTVMSATWAMGYGGLLVVRHTIHNEPRLVIYGHLDPTSMKKDGSVKAGETIALLGDHQSTETDKERKHLHFSVQNSTVTDIRGYVPTKNDLSKWIDPLSLYN